MIFYYNVIHFETPSSKWEVTEAYSSFQNCQDPVVSFSPLLWQICEGWEVLSGDRFEEDWIPEWGWTSKSDDEVSSTDEIHLRIEGEDSIPKHQCAWGWGNLAKIESIVVKTGIAWNRGGSSILFAGWRIKTIELEWGGMDQ